MGVCQDIGRATTSTKGDGFAEPVQRQACDPVVRESSSGCLADKPRQRPVKRQAGARATHGSIQRQRRCGAASRYGLARKKAPPRPVLTGRGRGSQGRGAEKFAASIWQQQSGGQSSGATDSILAAEDGAASAVASAGGGV